MHNKYIILVFMTAMVFSSMVIASSQRGVGGGNKLKRSRRIRREVNVWSKNFSDNLAKTTFNIGSQNTGNDDNVGNFDGSGSDNTEANPRIDTAADNSFGDFSMGGSNTGDFNNGNNNYGDHFGGD